MSATFRPRASGGAIRRREPASAATAVLPQQADFAVPIRSAAVAALLLYAMLVVLYPPALTGRISIPTAPTSIIDVFDLAMAGTMPTWLLFPVDIGSGEGTARAAAALMLFTAAATR